MTRIVSRKGAGAQREDIGLNHEGTKFRRQMTEGGGSKIKGQDAKVMIASQGVWNRFLDSASPRSE
ncbi:MAG: hypothetical protein JW720_07200 [Sedimentisphaerales bacterium]|nr:hypothetical protein [Sedimentisphaerales bacterium]